MSPDNNDINWKEEFRTLISMRLNAMKAKKQNSNQSEAKALFDKTIDAAYQKIIDKIPAENITLDQLKDYEAYYRVIKEVKRKIGHKLWLDLSRNRILMEKRPLHAPASGGIRDFKNFLLNQKKLMEYARILIEGTQGVPEKSKEINDNVTSIRNAFLSDLHRSANITSKKNISPLSNKPKLG